MTAPKPTFDGSALQVKATGASSARALADLVATSPVLSVATRTGAITLTHADLTDWAAATAGFGVGSTGVTSLGGTTGVVTLSANFGIAGNILVANYGTAASTIMQGNDARVVGAMQKSQNLADVASASGARTSLGLGSMAVQNASSVNITGGSAVFATVSFGHMTTPQGPVTITGDVSNSVQFQQAFQQLCAALHTDGLIINATTNGGVTPPPPVPGSGIQAVRARDFTAFMAVETQLKYTGQGSGSAYYIGTDNTGAAVSTMLDFFQPGGLNSGGTKGVYTGSPVRGSGMNCVRETNLDDEGGIIDLVLQHWGSIGYKFILGYDYPGTYGGDSGAGARSEKGFIDYMISMGYVLVVEGPNEVDNFGPYSPSGSYTSPSGGVATSAVTGARAVAAMQTDTYNFFNGGGSGGTTGGLPAVSRPLSSASSGTWTSATFNGMPYALLLPQGYNPALYSYPLLLLLHSSGPIDTTPLPSTSNYNAQVLQPEGYDDFNDNPNWLPQSVLWADSARKNYAAIIVVPMINVADTSYTVSTWGGYGATITTWGQNAHDLVVALTNGTGGVTKLSVDQSRIYVAGFSYGGMGAWEQLRNWPTMYAGAITMSGNYNNTVTLSSGALAPLKNIPIWAIHGSTDSVISPARDQSVYDTYLGPSAGGLMQLTLVAANKFSAQGLSDVHACARWEGMSNVSYWNWLFSQARTDVGTGSGNGPVKIAMFTNAGQSGIGSTGNALQTALSTYYSKTPAQVANYGNAHGYPVNGQNWGDPTSPGAGGNMDVQVANNTSYTIALGMPTIISECGFVQGNYDGGDSAGNYNGKMGSNYVNGCYIPQLYWHGFNYRDANGNPIVKLDYYQLSDGLPDDGTQETHFGLFFNNKTPKGGAVTLNAMLQIVSDTGATAATFTPGKLDYTLSGMPTHGESCLLERADGTFIIGLWGNTSIYTGGTYTGATASNVTIAFGTAPAHVYLYDSNWPGIASPTTSPPDYGTMTALAANFNVVGNASYATNMPQMQPVQAWASPSSVALSLGDGALYVVVKP